jgi:DNA (cytosine-5)-methyltransferase 1
MNIPCNLGHNLGMRNSFYYCIARTEFVNYRWNYYLPLSVEYDDWEIALYQVLAHHNACTYWMRFALVSAILNEVPLHDDIKTLESSSIPAAHLWAAGWPCQDLSHANTDRTGLKGLRSGLFYNFTKLAKEIQPQWLVLENVVGLLSAEGGEAFEAVTNELEEIGYLGGWLTCNTLDAGLPHNRERVFIVASYRSEAAYEFFSNCCELFGDTSARRTGGANPGPGFREEFIGNTPLLVQRRGGFGYTKAKDISPTIRAQTGLHQGGHSDRPILCGQKFDLGRVRETNGISARLDGRRGRLIGNSVAPPLPNGLEEKSSKSNGSKVDV